MIVLVAQDVPTVEAKAADEIVVRATIGGTTMLFDKGADGKLRNCRIMVSSGSQKRDTAACQATPVCYSGTADEVTDCVDLVVIEPKGSVAPTPTHVGSGVAVLDIAEIAKPKPRPTSAVGPIGEIAESREADRQRVKLPPLPSPRSGSGAVIKITAGNGQ